MLKKILDMYEQGTFQSLNCLEKKNLVTIKSLQLFFNVVAVVVKGDFSKDVVPPVKLLNPSLTSRLTSELLSEVSLAPLTLPRPCCEP